MADRSEFMKFVELVQNIRKNASFSLPALTKPFIISSPVFIQESVFRSSENTVNNILSAVYDMYIGYVMLAVKLDSYIGNGKKVSDVLSQVSTSGTYIDGTSNIVTSIDNALESLGSIDPNMTHPNAFKEVDDLVNGFKFGKRKSEKVILAKEDGFIEEKTSKPLISGKTIQIEVPRADDRGTVNITLFIQLVPRVFPDSIVSAIMQTQIKPEWRKRFFQYKAGEISFMRDLILSVDLREKQAQALKDDKSNTIFDLLRKRNASLLKKIGALAGFVQSHNFKDATFIFDRNSLNRGANDAGINFNNYSSRQSFFNKTSSMFVLAVDENYGRVDFYVDGMPKAGEYSFNQLTTQAKKKDVDLMEIIKSFQQGSAQTRGI